MGVRRQNPWHASAKPQVTESLGMQKMSQRSAKTAFGGLFDPRDAFPARKPYSHGVCRITKLEVDVS